MCRSLIRNVESEFSAFLSKERIVCMQLRAKIANGREILRDFAGSERTLPAVTVFLRPEAASG